MSEERRLELDFPAQQWGEGHTTGTLTRTVTPRVHSLEGLLSMSWAAGSNMSPSRPRVGS